MLEPDKIRNKRFGTSKNGLNPADVTECLGDCADEIERLKAQNAENEEKIKMLVEKINEYRNDEDAIKSAMIHAQKESNKLIADAKAKARDLIDSAKTEQIRLQETNSEEIERIKKEHHDTVDGLIAKLKEADGLVIGTPVYYAHPSGRILSFLDRVFYSSSACFAFKPAASVAIARRGGTTASFDVLNKYFGISQMPVAGSTYWNIAHGTVPGEASEDPEGMQTMRNLARNLAWMIKCIQAGRDAGIHDPSTEAGARTNFVR